MKKLLLSVFLLSALLLAVAPVHAVNLRDWETEVLVEDGSSLWTVVLRYKENITRSDYFVPGKITDVDVIADELPIKCAVAERVGTSITCDGIANARKMTYKFRLLQEPEDFRGYNVFRYRQSVTQFTDRFYMVIKLPLGAALAEKSELEGTALLPYEPADGEQGTDGRRIFVEWGISEPQLGRTIDFYVIYEKLQSETSLPFTPVVGFFLMVVAIGAVVLYLRRSPMREVLPVLTEGERKVVEILLREKKTVDQRVIVRELDYSKSKISRIVKNLMDRGLVEKTPKGRTNILRLKKPSETPESSEKSQGKK